jgi:hypothetical protein
VSAVLPFPRQDSALPYARGAASFLSCGSHARQYGEERAVVDTRETGAFLNTVIRRLYPRHTVKMLARLLEVPIGTAQSLIYKRLSKWRRRELAEKLLQEIYGEIHSHIELCMRLEEMTGKRNGEVDAAGGCENAARDLPDQKTDPLLAAARWCAEKARQ